MKNSSKLFNLCYLAMFLSGKTTEIPTNKILLENKNILILGGTGYLGTALTTEILKYNPESIIIFSRDEVKHFVCKKNFNNNPKIKNIIGDIRDYNSLLFATRDIDIVFHVAALKRMDDLESNVEEAIKTNILGSLNVFHACVENKVNKVVFISTDKSCSPINTYGACKFISEKIFTHYDKKKISTKFMATRFGNILESTGSVIPIFTEKIKNGDDIPLTDDKMTRFIIHKKEAVEFIFNVLKYGTGGEIFVKKTPSLKIIDLIDILKSKFNSNNNIKLIGLRPGEKIHEVLINESEMPRTYEFENLYIITPSLKEWLPEDPREMPLYIKRGHSLANNLKEYSSYTALISKEEVSEIFKTIGLI